MGRFNTVTLAVLCLSLIALFGCEDLEPHDVPSLLDPTLSGQRSLAFWRVLERLLPLYRTWSECSSAGRARA
jgi:hypothetical protein